MNDIEWICPICGAVNLDSYTNTALPICNNCEQHSFWDDLLTPEQMVEANNKMRLEIAEEK